MRRHDWLSDVRRLASDQDWDPLAARLILRQLAASPGGDDELVSALKLRLNPFLRTLVIEGLGWAAGPAGDAVLIELATASGRGSRDLRIAALASLADRVGRQATHIYSRALDSRDSQVQQAGLFALLVGGDDSAWERAYTFARALPASRDGRWLDPLPCAALAYLLRNVLPDERVTALRALVRGADLGDLGEAHDWGSGSCPSTVGAEAVEGLPEPDRLVRWLICAHAWAHDSGYPAPGYALAISDCCTNGRWVTFFGRPEGPTGIAEPRVIHVADDRWDVVYASAHERTVDGRTWHMLRVQPTIPEQDLAKVGSTVRVGE